MPGFSATDAIFNFPDSVVARLRPFGKGNQACPVGVPNLTPGWECPVAIHWPEETAAAGGQEAAAAGGKQQQQQAAAARENQQQQQQQQKEAAAAGVQEAAG